MIYKIKNFNIIQPPTSLPEIGIELVIVSQENDD